MIITTEFTVIVVIVTMRLECVLLFGSSTTSRHPDLVLVIIATVALLALAGLMLNQELI